MLRLLCLCFAAFGLVSAAAEKPVMPAKESESSQGDSQPNPIRKKKASSGIVAGGAAFSPRTASSKDLGSNINRFYFVGVRLSPAYLVGIRYGRGSVTLITSPDGIVTPVSDYQLGELFSERCFFLFRPDPVLLFYLPVHLGLPINVVNDGTANYWNMGVSAGSGLGMRLFTGSPLIVDMKAQYHFALPFWDIRHSSDSGSIKNESGRNVAGSVTGFELSISATLVLW